MIWPTSYNFGLGHQMPSTRLLTMDVALGLYWDTRVGFQSKLVVHGEFVPRCRQASAREVRSASICDELVHTWGRGTRFDISLCPLGSSTPSRAWQYRARSEPIWLGTANRGNGTRAYYVRRLSHAFASASPMPRKMGSRELFFFLLFT